MKAYTVIGIGETGMGKSTFLNAYLQKNSFQASDSPDSCTKKTSVDSNIINNQTRKAIDTPGIKGFGTFDIEKEELTSYFREIFEFSKECKFSNCTHTHEPGCAVRKAVEDHFIAESRYQSYLSMLEDKEENKYREAF